MKAKRKLTQPPPEFDFAAKYFNLVLESTEDGWRVVAERERRRTDRRLAELNQPALPDLLEAIPEGASSLGRFNGSQPNGKG
jgi:hypothetical protein